MGSVCCVAAKDRTITSGPASDVLSRNIRHSPSWSFRWENRGRVVGEETSITWLSDGIRSNDRVDVKARSTLGTTYTSEESSPLDSFRSVTWQKSPALQEVSGPSRLPFSDSPDFRVHKQAHLTLSPTISDPSPPKLSPSAPSASSFSMSPLSSKGHPLPLGSTPSRPRLSPGHRLLRQVSDSRIPGFRSPTFSISEEVSSFGLPCWGNESTGGSNVGSSDSWSIPTFSEVATSHRERWSFDSESFGCVRDKIRTSGLSSGSISFDLRTCGICTKLLSEKSSFGSQKFFVTNELAVSAVLPCAHIYHAECLESMTSEVNKYDPLCPICTFGEKQALKMSEKVLRAKMDLRTRRSSISRIVDSDLSSDVREIGHQKISEFEGGGPKVSSSSSTKGSLVKPFLRSHSSFESKSCSRSLSKNSSRKKVLFWTKSSKA
ncbi:hypothetical protein LIER_21804 [Lithospermum erythrorhizon]|uniref:RING-type domain-containing protein n=1 Tax=Lithospermum erythrorhizon TaxID=34254 RepID=A0AAV3QT34_LITER